MGLAATGVEAFHFREREARAVRGPRWAHALRHGQRILAVGVHDHDSAGRVAVEERDPFDRLRGHLARERDRETEQEQPDDVLHRRAPVDRRVSISRRRHT